MRIKTEGSLLRAPETFQGQAGRGKQDESERYLGDNQARPRALTMRAFAAAASASLMQIKGER
jgi:hypothetical protein